MIFSFDIKNKAFGKSDIYTLLDSNRDCLKVMIMNLNSKGSWQQVVLVDKNEKNDDNFDITLNNDTIFVNCNFNSAIFEEQDFQKYPLYATYTIVYSNETLPIEPTPHNYIFKDTKFEIITPADLNDENIQKADAILNKWINQDSLKINNVLTDEHRKFIIGKNRVISPDINSKEEINIILTQDNDSEEITFIIPRTYDGIDLSTKHLGIYYIRPKNQLDKEAPRGITEDLLVEKVEQDTIEATWTITNQVTSTAGILTYAIVAEGDGLKDDYFWQTLPSTFEIKKGIYGDLPFGEQDFSFIDKSSFRNDVYKTIEELQAIHEAGEIKWQSIASLLSKEA